MPVTINSNNLPVGVTHRIGNTQIKTITCNGVTVWQYDNTAPSIVVTSKGGYVTKSFFAYTLTFTVSDSESGVASVTVDGNAVTVGSNGSCEYSYRLGSQTETHTFTIVATDNAGNPRTVTHYIVYDPSGHAATLSTSLIRCTYRNSNGGTEYYTETSSSQLYEGSGVRVSTTAIYNFDVDLTQLPNYQDIKKVIINHARRRNDNTPISENKTYYPNGAASFHVDDSDSNSNDSNGATIGWTITARARAGVNSLTYYYA